MAKVIFKDQVYGSTDTVWIGTKAEYESNKSSIPDGYTVILTDDQTMGNLVIDDEVKSGSKNPVTSDAVYDNLSTITNNLKPTAAKNIDYTITKSTATILSARYKKAGPIVQIWMNINDATISNASAKTLTIRLNNIPTPTMTTMGVCNYWAGTPNCDKCGFVKLDDAKDIRIYSDDQGDEDGYYKGISSWIGITYLTTE